MAARYFVEQKPKQIHPKAILWAEEKEKVQQAMDQNQTPKSHPVTHYVWALEENVALALQIFIVDDNIYEI